jgi:uncharacterized protein YjbI with pentapeptide repeats
MRFDIGRAKGTFLLSKPIPLTRLVYSSSKGLRAWQSVPLKKQHLALLKHGAKAWNAWRKAHPKTRPQLGGAKLIGADLATVDLSSANLSVADLRRANLRHANLSGASLHSANLEEADLRGTNLRHATLTFAKLGSAQLHRANLSEADLSWGDFSGADLRKACLNRAILVKSDLHEADLKGATLIATNLYKADLALANLSGTNLSGADASEALLMEADLSKANLRYVDFSDTDLNLANLSFADLTGASFERSILVETVLKGSTLADCRIYGISAWNVNLDHAVQTNLIISRENEPQIAVDDLEVAQFVYLLLNNRKLRNIIDVMGKKAVLILGRFTPERKLVLDAMRQALRRVGYLPILFDFDRPSVRDTQETIVTLAGLVRFIIADITDPKSIPQELASVVPNLPSVPVQPLLQRGYAPWSMYDHIRRYQWVLPVHLYDNKRSLLADFASKVIAPAEAKASEVKLNP